MLQRGPSDSPRETVLPSANRQRKVSVFDTLRWRFADGRTVSRGESLGPRCSIGPTDSVTCSADGQAQCTVDVTRREGRPTDPHAPRVAPATRSPTPPPQPAGESNPPTGVDRARPL